MKILVTGATGSLGSRLVALWAGRFELTGTGRKEFRGPKPVRFVRGDLADAAFARAAVAGHDVVIHGAALASPWGPWEDFHRANVVATQNVVSACLAENVRQLVHISTPSIYYAPRDRRAIQESDPIPPPATNYAKSKLLAEEIVRASGLNSVILRPRGIFGPTDQVILPKILRLLRRGRFPLVRGGRPLVDLTHVDNVIHAIGLCLGKNFRAEAFHISNGEPITVRELVELIADRLDLPVRMIPVPLALGQGLAAFAELAHRLRRAPGEPALTKYGLGLLSFDQTLDLTKARAQLGYEPIIGLRAGLLDTLEQLA